MDGARDDLIGLSDYVFGRTRRRLDGLTDDEYRWEPVPGGWTVRRRADGTHRLDHSVWPESAPFTTLAWRLWHLICCYGQARNAQLLLGPAAATDPEADPGRRFEMHAEVPASADGAVQCLDDAQRDWRDLLAALSDEDLAAPMGEAAGPYADQQKSGYVLHMIDEFIHHGAELGMLRDLYRAREASATDPLLAALGGGPAADPALLARAIRNGHLWAVPRLVELGVPVDDRLDEVTGASPLHFAAAAGSLEVVQLLVEHGADPAQRDRRFGADAAGWARYYGRHEVADYLSGLG